MGMCGLILELIILQIFIEERSCPVLFEDFIFLISLFVCLVVMCGSVNLDLGLVIKCSSICVCVTWCWVNLLLMVTTLFMKCEQATLAIFLSDVTTVLLCIILLGGALVAVLVSSLTVVHNLLTLLTSGLIFVPFVLIELLLGAFVLDDGVCLLLIVSLLE